MFQFPQSTRPIIAGLLCSLAVMVGAPQSLTQGYAAVNSIMSGGYSTAMLWKFMVETNNL